MVTGSDDNKRIVQRWHDAWNTHDDSLLLQLADEIYAPDLIIHHPAPRPDERSLASWKQGVVAWIKDVPDNHVTLEDLFGEGNKVALRYAVHGFRVSTGQAIELRGNAIWRFADGKIVEIWE